jgi:putative thioredoxin
MSDTPYAFEVTADSFQQYVLENSFKVPVLVDFWAEWCAPCQTLMPLLAGLAAEYNGQFLLAKVNSDMEQSLAQQYGVRSLPTVKVFRNGEIVDEFMGAQPESVIRALLEQHIERESDKLRMKAMASLEQGDADTALEVLTKARETDPDNPRVTLDLARLKLQLDELDAAETLLQSLPRDKQEEDDARALMARISIAKATQDAPDHETLKQQIADNPDDLKARLQMANQCIALGEYADGLEQFLEIMKRDRSFEDDAGRKGLLNTFEMLGGQSDLISAYRRKMAMLLY